MKIVIICPYLFELRRGIERYCLSLSDALIARGAEVTMYVWHSSNRNACGDINKKIKIRTVPNPRYYRDQIASFFYRIWLYIDSPDITILNFMYHGEEFLPKDSPYLYVLHSPASQIPSRYEYASKILPDFKHLRIIAISKMVEDEAKHYTGSTPMSLIYNGTDTHKFQPTHYESKSYKLKVISAAAFEERKGLHLVVEALRDSDIRERIEYHIYGGGNKEYELRLRQMIRDYNLDGCVTLMGNVDNLSEIMPQYDVFILPSKGEAFALSPIEAMACGLPIIVSNCPPYPEFVTSDFGFMVDINNPQQINDAITFLVDNPIRLQDMKKCARRKSEEYSWNSVVNHYIKAITQTIK